MRNIALFSSSEDKLFKHHLLNLLGLLSINYEENSAKIGDNSQNFDYIILDSSSLDEKLDLTAGFCFINMDHPHDKNIQLYGNIITYGFGNKNTVTISSIEDGNFGFVYCLQRYLNQNALGMMAPQEIPVCKSFNDNQELYAFMVAITIGLIEGIENKDIIKKLQGD